MRKNGSSAANSAMRMASTALVIITLEIIRGRSDQPLQAALAHLVALDEFAQLGTDPPSLDHLEHCIFTQPIDDPPRHGRVRFRPNAQLWILRHELSIFADPSPRASQQVSKVPSVGVGPRKVHRCYRRSEPVSRG